MHGIGDHDDWSQLGSPTLLERPPEGPEAALPPTVPQHDLLLVNWSRASRGVAGFLWYVALPFTLVNAAGYMTPPDGLGPTAERRTRFAVVLTGLLLSLLTFVWALALAETIARRTLVTWTSSPDAGRWLAGAIGLALIAGMLGRQRRTASHTKPLVLWLNVLLVGSAAAVTAFTRPAHWQVTWSKMPDFLTTWGPSATFVQAPGDQPPGEFKALVANGQLVPYVDPVVSVSLFCIVVVVLTGAVFAIRGLIAAGTGRPATPEYVVDVALVGSVLLMVSVASALRLFADNLVLYLSNHHVPLFAEPGETAGFGSRALLPPRNRLYVGRDDALVDMLPLVGLLALLAFALAFVVANWTPRGAGRPRFGKRGSTLAKRLAAARWHRRLVLSLESTLGPTILLSTFLWGVSMAMVVNWILDGSNATWDRAIFTVQALSVLAIFMVVAGRSLQKVRKVVGMVADVLGFWPVASHPFAGASYRNQVVDGIIDEVRTAGRRPTVLIGHSQGSVLCAWAVHRIRTEEEFHDTGPALTLVTCGCPLESLYREVFPAYFPGSFYTSIWATTPWLNFWRATDPIATPLPLPQPQPVDATTDNLEIADPDAARRLQVHSDYWIAPEQVERVALCLPQAGRHRDVGRRPDVVPAAGKAKG
ncbi:hypothetical protein ASD66_05170 [Nocardioides sp. Root151]|nr:hypothetical protein ASD30_21445 [Nocardioides sp. Root140]KQZ75724.1 hypothetical protein ASD66_05170 [Nocardioides sp. Root151]KRF14796.1 hypothetical protein ASH02_10955 [Nocardioides sp. Soil796]